MSRPVLRGEKGPEGHVLGVEVAGGEVDAPARQGGAAQPSVSAGILVGHLGLRWCVLLRSLYWNIEHIDFLLAVHHLHTVSVRPYSILRVLYYVRGTWTIVTTWYVRNILSFTG